MPRIKPIERKYYVGIDPGKKGAICFYCPTEKHIFNFYDWPKDDNVIDIFKQWSCLTTGNTILEKVNAMPKQGVTSMFNFGRNFGQWIAMLQILQLPYHLLPPQQWRKGIVYPSDGNPKEAAFKAFQRLFPECIDQVKGAKGAIKDGRVDAALMAYKAYTM